MDSWIWRERQASLVAEADGLVRALDRRVTLALIARDRPFARLCALHERAVRRWKRRIAAAPRVPR